MEDGSKITGHRSTGSDGAVYVTSDNANFIMRGGIITDNITGFSGNTMVGGVFINAGGRFTMQGGVITGNTRLDGEPRDIFINFQNPDRSIFNLSGDTTIGHLIIQAIAGTGYNTYINGVAGPYTGTIQHLYLHTSDLANTMASAIANWLGKTVIGGSNVLIIRNSIQTGVSFVPQSLPLVQDISDISAPHHISASGVLTAGPAP